jgi:hypothetical protein
LYAHVRKQKWIGGVISGESVSRNQDGVSASQSCMLGRKIFRALEKIPTWLFKFWKQTPQVSAVFDSGSIRICADSINPQPCSTKA